MNHELVEKNVVWLGILIVVAIAFGGIVEIVPLMFQTSTTQPAQGLQLRTPLQVAGRAASGVRHAGRVVTGRPFDNSRSVGRNIFPRAQSRWSFTSSITGKSESTMRRSSFVGVQPFGSAFSMRSRSAVSWVCVVCCRCCCMRCTVSMRFKQGRLPLSVG